MVYWRVQGSGVHAPAGTRGTPWRFEVARADSAVTTLAFANFSTALVLPTKGARARPVRTMGTMV